jgi:leucyl aminopeptidase
MRNKSMVNLRIGSMLKYTAVSLDQARIGLLAVPLCEDTPIHEDPQVLKLTAAAAALEEFSGENNQQVLLYNPEGTKVQRCLCMGLGSREKVTAETLRCFAGRAVQAAIKARQDRLVVAVPAPRLLALESRSAIQALMEGALLANHIFDQYKQKSKDKPLKEIVLRTKPQITKALAGLIPATEAVCRCTLQAREWINTPSNAKVPVQLADMVTRAALKTGLKITRLTQAQLKQKHFGALLAVAAGSSHPPCLVEMCYAPTAARKTIVLVGKGVTFDTGGISLKQSSGMEAMKGDMSGAAAVAATLIAVSRLKPRHRIVGIMPMVENMPSGSATRPGDIVSSYAGKTVEIGNTDAEGRLILIDAMAYAVKKYKPDVMIDLATLTGACVVALGERLAGVFSRDDELTRLIVASGQTVHERCWPMPLPEDYKELLKSDYADISNMPGSRYGGAITAALFLSEFVGQTRWAHIDIAGPAFVKKGGDYCGPGGSGFGVRLLCDLLDKL